MSTGQNKFSSGREREIRSIISEGSSYCIRMQWKIGGEISVQIQNQNTSRWDFCFHRMVERNGASLGKESKNEEMMLVAFDGAESTHFSFP